MAKNKEKGALREALRIHLRALREINRRCPGLFLRTFLANLLKGVTPYVTIWLSARIINELAGPCRAEVLWKLVFITLFAEAALGLLHSALEQWSQAGELIFSEQCSQMIAEKMLDMDFADADCQKTHDLCSQIRQNENWMGWGMGPLYELVTKLTHACVGILGAVALSVSLFVLPVPQGAGKLTALNHPVFLTALLVLLIGITVMGPACANRAQAMFAATAETCKFGNRVFDVFGSFFVDRAPAPDIRMYRQERIAKHYLMAVDDFGPDGRLARMFRGKYGVLMGFSEGLPVLLMGLVYLFVCLKALGGAFGIGSVTQYVAALTTLSGNLGMLIKVLGTVKNNAPFLRTVYELLDIPNSMYQGSLTTEKRSDRQYAVEFRDVSFRYPGSELWALRHVNMKFKVGKRLAVVGENGSGKTTFIKLLCRLYDPQEGQILLNGIDIRKYRYDDYMQIFSVVFQDFRLLSQPLGANVAGREEYNRERVERCLREAGFGERLEAMPDGLETVLYKELQEDGVEVSGGEAQKIAIARALYKDAPFIILDEPTAALDPIAEAEIYSKFDEIAGDKTAIYISHRLSSCKFCDEIAVFRAGSVCQQGTHEQLLHDTDGKYAQLWHAQAQYYTK